MKSALFTITSILGIGLFAAVEGGGELFVLRSSLASLPPVLMTAAPFLAALVGASIGWFSAAAGGQSNCRSRRVSKLGWARQTPTTVAVVVYRSGVCRDATWAKEHYGHL